MWRDRSTVMSAAADQEFVPGSYSSAPVRPDAEAVLPPPVTSTLPSGSKVALCQ